MADTDPDTPSASPLGRIATLFRELKRRKVYQVSAIYAVLAVGMLELLDLLIPATSLPGWASPLLLGLALVGLPIVVVLAWTFDVTPSGVVRTEDAKSGSPHPSPADVELERARHPDDLDLRTVAVLPFENLSGSAEAEPFAVGLHDDLLTELSRASALTVISRTSVRGYRATERSIREIARELGAGAIVEGGVQQAGGRVRLNIQLIDARDDAHLWAERYDRELSTETIFDLQSELASRIMAALEAQLTTSEKAREHERPTDDLEAYRLYALGRDAFVDRSEAGIRRAVELFQDALARDPEYAPAWAGLGMALIALVDYGHTESDDLVERGAAACERALELDPQLPEAHAAMGTLHALRWQGPAALKALRRATTYGPSLALGHQWTSWVELLVGDPHAARSGAIRATQLNPLDPEARGNLALANLALGDLDAAVSEARRSLDTHPDFAYSLWILGLSHWAQGSLDDAVDTLGSNDEPPFRPWADMVSGIRAAQSGERDAASRLARGLSEADAHVKAAAILTALSDVDGAFEAIERAKPLFWDDVLALRYLRVEPFATLRRDPRYDQLMEELNRRWGV